MLNLSESENRAMQADLLGRQYPLIKSQIRDGEVWLAYSQRKPKLLPGIFCILIGAFTFAQISMYYLFSNPLLALPVMILSVFLVILGVWLAVLIKNEYVFVTSIRVAHRRVSLFGVPGKTPFSIPISDISSVHLYRGSIMWRAFSKSEGGDILIKKKSGTYLIPSLKESENLSEVLMAEVAFHKARQHPGEAAG